MQHRGDQHHPGRLILVGIAGRVGPAAAHQLLGHQHRVRAASGIAIQRHVLGAVLGDHQRHVVRHRRHQTLDCGVAYRRGQRIDRHHHRRARLAGHRRVVGPVDDVRLGDEPAAVQRQHVLVRGLALRGDRHDFHAAVGTFGDRDPTAHPLGRTGVGHTAAVPDENGGILGAQLLQRPQDEPILQRRGTGDDGLRPIGDVADALTPGGAAQRQQRRGQGRGRRLVAVRRLDGDPLQRREETFPLRSRVGARVGTRGAFARALGQPGTQPRGVGPVGLVCLGRPDLAVAGRGSGPVVGGCHTAAQPQQRRRADPRCHGASSYRCDIALTPHRAYLSPRVPVPHWITLTSCSSS